MLPDTIDLSFEEVLAEVKDKPRSGRPQVNKTLGAGLSRSLPTLPPQVMPPGSTESEAMRELVMRDEEHWNKTWPEIGKELEFNHARSTYENVMHKHHNIHRYVRRRKPRLDDELQARRQATAELALEIEDEGEFVFTDEMWLEFNSTRRKGKKQSRPKGANPYKYAENKRKDQGTIRVMVAACVAKGFKRQLYIFNKTDLEETAREKEIAAEVNTQLAEEARVQQQNARIENTHEHRILQEFNANVDHQNIEEGRTGKYKKRHRKPESMFKLKPIGLQSKGGVNWVSYREKYCEGSLPRTNNDSH